MSNKDEFWKHKDIHSFTHDEWEALCDCCGKCCLYKIEDEETGAITLTYVACSFLHIKSCTCTQYENRHSINPECIQLKPESIQRITWLPATCAYRLIAEGKNLPPWHPLITKNPDSTKTAHKSIAEIAISIKNVKDIKNHIIIEI